MSVTPEPHLPKTKEQYSKNVKILKYQLQKLEQDIKLMQSKLSSSHSIDNDRILAMRFAKQCRIRKFTPEMIYRFADTEYKKEIDQITFTLILKSLGFNLSQDEIKKITLLIDEDMSGKLSHEEYIEYLQAFNINTQTPQRTTVKGIKGAKIKNISEIIGKDRMIDWEQFYKYMKDKFPLMKQKELIKIFNKLDPNNTGKISLSELKKLLQKLMNEEEQAKKKPAKKKQTQGKEIKKQESFVNIDASTLQNKIHALLKYRNTKSKLFHMTEFKKVGHKLNEVKGFVKLFKDVDTNKIGSIMVIDMIRYYLQKKAERQTYKSVYELMNYKLYTENQTIQQFLFDNGFRDDSYVKQSEFCHILKQWFEIEEFHSKKMYKQIQDELPQNDKRVTSVNIVNKFRQVQRDLSDVPDPNDLIPLVYSGTKQHQFFKKDVGSIVFSPLLALKFCLHLQNQILAKNKKSWMDPEFGITYQDRRGYLSVTGRQMLDVDFGIDEEDLTWNRVENLNMKQFYDKYNSKQYHIGKIHNPQFVSGLTLLPQYYQNILWNQLPPVKTVVDKLTQNDLVSVFTGIYPKAFHYFARYGIYVFRYFIQNRFIYVIMDDYIPTMTSKQIIFSHAKQSWISLIEKGYAKLEGSYANMLHRQSIYEVIYELCHLCPVDLQIPPEIINDEKSRKHREAFWLQILRIFDSNSNILISCFNDGKKQKLQCKGKQTELIGQQSVQIISALEIQNKQADNSHKSHRLLILKFSKNKQINDKFWNSSWSKHCANNKYDTQKDVIKKILKQKGQFNASAQLEMNHVLVINYERFRSLYDRIYYLQDLQNQKWNSKMTLDRMLKQGYKNVSQFRIESRMKTQVVLALLKRVEKPGTIQLMFGEINKQPIARKVSTQDFVFLKIPAIEANVQYIIYVYSEEEIIDFYLTFHLLTKDFKVWKSNGPAIFHDSKKLEGILGEYKDTDSKVKQYLETKLFSIEQKKKGTGCCG